MAAKAACFFPNTWRQTGGCNEVPPRKLPRDLHLSLQADWINVISTDADAIPLVGSCKSVGNDQEGNSFVPDAAKFEMLNFYLPE